MLVLDCFRCVVENKVLLSSLLSRVQVLASYATFGIIIPFHLKFFSCICPWNGCLALLYCCEDKIVDFFFFFESSSLENLNNFL